MYAVIYMQGTLLQGSLWPPRTDMHASRNCTVIQVRREGDKRRGVHATSGTLLSKTMDAF